MSIEEILKIISLIIGILGSLTGTGLYIKFSKKCKNYREKKRLAKERINKLPDQIEKLTHRIENICESQENLAEDLTDLNDSRKKFEDRFDQFETSQLRYMINDSCFGYKSLHEVPDEQLYNVAECCDIYLSKGLNHGTDIKCKLIAEEIERRQRKRAEGMKDA